MKVRLLDEIDCPTHAEIVAWGKAHGWNESPYEERIALAWTRLVREGSSEAVNVPARSVFDDYVARCADAVNTIAAYDDRAPAQVAREMTAGRGGAA